MGKEERSAAKGVDYYCRKLLIECAEKAEGSTVKEQWSTGKGGVDYKKRSSGVHEKEEGSTGNGGLEYRKRRSEVQEKDSWST
jgi:hypothetical protein